MRLWQWVLWFSLACGCLAAAATAEEISLGRVAEGRYLVDGASTLNDGVLVVGQGQAGWLSFDIRPLHGKRVDDLRFAYVQIATTNPHLFPITIGIYDVSTRFDRLSVNRNPLNAEGLAIALDLRTGDAYATYQVLAAGQGASFEYELNAAAIRDLQEAIDNAAVHFSIGLANVVFNAGGYFVPDNGRLLASVGRAPDCTSAESTVDVLWPPNHSFVTVGVDGVVDPDGDPVTVEITSVLSDEPTYAFGDGNSCPDAILSGETAMLRAERAGKGNGRVYTVQFTATDASGHSCNGSVEVCVPHDRGSGCTKDDLAVDATSCGPAPRRRAQGDASILSLQTSDSHLGVRFVLHEPGVVQLAVYDIGGRLVRRLVNDTYGAGEHFVQWNGFDSSGRELPSGVYLFRLETDEEVRSAKVVLMR